MSNPENALGTNGAYGGRTSVNAFNDVLAVFTGRGILSGWACVPDSGLTVELGGNGTDRDVAIAENSAGDKTSVNNISQAPVSVTMPAAPVANSRIDAIVAYIEASPSSSGETDNYTAVNLLTVSGTTASTPTAPSDSDIRTAITADGAAGSTAYYVVLAYITIASGTTDIDATMITAGESAQIGTDQILDGAVTSDKIDFATFADYSTSEVNTGIKWVDGKNIYRKTIYTGNLPNNDTAKNIPHGISNLDYVIKLEGTYSNNDGTYTFPTQVPSVGGDNTAAIRTFINGNNVVIHTGMDRHLLSGYVTLYYTKTS